jgi:AraC-like DNA-binding protein
MPKSMEENGLVLLDNMPASKTFKFPVHCYHGIAVVFSMDRCQCELMNMFKAVGVDFAALIEKIQPLTLPLKLPSSEHVSHIFSELYRLPKNIRLPYFKIKVLELILFLSRLDSEAKYETAAQIPSAYKSKMELLREILRENVEEHLTLEQLSKQIEMSPTQMKKYFKLAYGDSIYSYLKTYRMKKATQLLLDGKFNVAEVASRVGYTNSSKFAQAFKEYTGCSPKEYKNKT